MYKIVISRLIVVGDTLPTAYMWLLCGVAGDVRCTSPHPFDSEQETRAHALNTLRMIAPAINSGHGVAIEVQDITVPPMPALPGVGA
jgi:hypothetical protein